MSDSRLDAPAAPSGEDYEGLEDERDFLLRSLDDLDTELLAGNIDPDKYRVLHDDYTARASAVIRALEDGEEREAKEARRGPPGVRVATIGGIVVFALLAAFLLAHAVGQRNAGGQITGDAQSNGATPTTLSEAQGLAQAKAAALAQPNNYAAVINYARALTSDGDYPDAIQEFVAASKIDPKQAEPLAYSGWLTALVSQQVTDAATQNTLRTAAMRNFDQAISADPTYAASYAFKGLMLATMENQPCAGAVVLQQYLVTAPVNDPMRSDVTTALSTAVTAGKCPASITSPTAKP